MTALLPDAQRFFQDFAPLYARFAIWNKRFAPSCVRLKNTQLQKASATDDGLLILTVYRPGDDKSAVVMSIRKSDAGVILTHDKPQTQPKPNAIVQVIRKYLLGRRISFVYASLNPVALVIEFASSPDITDPELKNGPDALILDLDSKNPRICVAKRFNEIPKRYDDKAANFQIGDVFFESFCEWDLQSTKTKRRATFDVPLLLYSPMPREAELAGAMPLAPAVATRATQSMPAITSAPITNERALMLLPTHVRKPARTRLQFLERRILKQKGDLPLEADIERLLNRAEGLRANLYLWPKDSNIWYVPRDVIEAHGLPAMMQLTQGYKPGDLLNAAFLEVEKLQRRFGELKVRVAQSEKALADFSNLLISSGEAIQQALTKAKEEGRLDKPLLFGVNLDSIFDFKPPEQVLQLCQMLEVGWSETQEKRRVNTVEASKRLPYRQFSSSTGEFIRVAKSGPDGDEMLRMMPAHHFWLHVLTGEGSHVWLENPKRHDVSDAAVREAAILAVHYSKHSRNFSADVRFAKRSDVEKKKDLPTGKVLVRRFETLLIRFENPELQQILAMA